MYNLKIVLPPNERFQSTKESAQIMQNANTGFCLLDLKRRHAGFATIDDAKKILSSRDFKYSTLGQFMPDPKITFGFKAFKARYGWRSKETFPNGKEIKQQLHLSGYKECCKKIDKIIFPSGNSYTLILVQSRNGDFITIKQKNENIISKYIVKAKDRKFSKKGLLKHVERFALKIGQNPDGSERPVLRKVGGVIFDIARMLKR